MTQKKLDQETVLRVLDVLRDQQELELLTHGRALLAALDRGYLNYTADSPESAFVAHFRAAIARAEKARL